MRQSRILAHRQCFRCETVRDDGAQVVPFRGRLLRSRSAPRGKERALCEGCLYDAAEMLAGGGLLARRAITLARRSRGSVVFP